MANHAKRNKKKTIIRSVILALAGLIIGYGVYSFNASRVIGNKMPMPFGYGVSVILTGSMEPELSVDDLIIVKETDTVAVGDDIVFQDGNSLIVHRVKEIGEDTVTTRGIANNADDDPIKFSQIKGVVVKAIPKIGVILDFVKQPAVFFLLIFAIFFLMERSFRKEKKSDSDELTRIKEEIERLKNADSANVENDNDNSANAENEDK